MSDYNGWTNRATWLINVWFEPRTSEDVIMARETFEEAVSELSEKHSWLADFVDTDINWGELEEHCEEEEENE
jgi:hypothetical protein